MRRNMESIRRIATCEKIARYLFLSDDPMIKYRRIPTAREGYDHLCYANTYIFFRAEGGRVIRRKRQMASRLSGENYLRGVCESPLLRSRPEKNAYS